MVARSRSRTDPIGDVMMPTLVMQKLTNGAWVDTSTVYRGLNNSQRMLRTYEHCQDRISEGLQTNPLRLEKQSSPWPDVVNSASYPAVTGAYGVQYRLKGGFVMAGIPTGQPSTLFTASDLANQENQLLLDGQDGFIRTRPLRPIVSLGQTIAEASSLPRMLKSSARFFHTLWKSMGGKRKLRDTSKAVASEWLNTQYGWSPFLGDMRGMFSTLTNISRTIDEVRRQNGVYRHVFSRISNESDEQVFAQSNTSSMHWPSISLSTIFIDRAHPGSMSATLLTSERSWYEGLVRYYVPSFNGPMRDSDAKIAARLFGLRITPTLLYELTPWSWLIDWFSNVGNQIQAFETIYLDGYHAKYACIMQTVSREVRVNSVLSLLTGPVSHTWTYGSTIKRRSGMGTPFGFNTSFDALSAWQTSILGALGLSRLR